MIIKVHDGALVEVEGRVHHVDAVAAANDRRRTDVVGRGGDEEGRLLTRCDVADLSPPSHHSVLLTLTQALTSASSLVAFIGSKLDSAFLLIVQFPSKLV